MFGHQRQIDKAPGGWLHRRRPVPGLGGEHIVTMHLLNALKGIGHRALAKLDEWRAGVIFV